MRVDCTSTYINVNRVCFLAVCLFKGSSGRGNCMLHIIISIRKRMLRTRSLMRTILLLRTFSLFIRVPFGFRINPFYDANVVAEHLPKTRTSGRASPSERRRGTTTTVQSSVYDTLRRAGGLGRR